MAHPSPSSGHAGLKFEEVLQTSCACGVLSIDASGRLAFVSPEAETILRLQSSDKARLEKLPPQLLELIHQTQTSGQPITDRKVTLHEDRGSHLGHRHAGRT